MKKLLLLPLLVVMMVSSPAAARIGETFEECQQRYGILMRVDSQFHPDYPQYCFKLGEIEILVRFYNGRSAEEIFTRSDADGDLTAAQTDEIVRSNRESSKEEIRWDLKKASRYSDMLVITTLEFYKIFRKDQGTGF
ncbi:MAG: hypothetical protein V7609_2107 [Verrucomicrobiota bacterium]